MQGPRRRRSKLPVSRFYTLLDSPTRAGLYFSDLAVHMAQEIQDPYYRIGEPYRQP